MYSKYKGVTFDKRTQRWVSQIRIAGETRYLGRSSNEQTAALLVDNARLFLQEFFPQSLKGVSLNCGIEPHSGPYDVTEALQVKLIAEGAPRYRQPGTENDKTRLLAELSAAQGEMLHLALRIGNLLKSLQQ